MEKGTLENLRDWYQNLEDKEKETTSIFAICGDTKNRTNEELVMGDPENLCMSLAIAMIESPDLYFLVESSLEAVKEYSEVVLKETKKETPLKGTFLS